jgi:selenocysteine-specific elongation factor
VTVVIGTAGHIDHGKTTLLRALTGIDADRLPEERARGMTIDVGYAHLRLDDGSEVDFVDVPGHDRLVGNMLVGAGEIDAALVVIAADDGPRAQTIEHLQLLDALGIGAGLVVVTKADAVSREGVDSMIGEVRTLVAGTSLAGSPVVAASALSGEGLDEVRRLVVDLRDRVLRMSSSDSLNPSRLATDRVFTVRGRGTVVTGTLRGQPVSAGLLLRVLPPAGASPVRVREVQVHGQAVPTGGPGRVALNLGGGSVAGLARGVVLTTSRDVQVTDRILVAARPAATFGPDGRSAGGRRATAATMAELRDRARVTIHLGTGHASGTISRSGPEAADLEAGEVTAILRLDRPIAAAAGDRFALRRPSPATTLGGGFVIDPEPPRGVARRRANRDRLRALVRAAGTADRAAWLEARLDLHGAALDPPGLAADIARAVDAALLDAAAIPEARRSSVLRAGSDRLRRLVGPLAGRSGRGPATDPLGGLVVGRLDDLVATRRLMAAGDRVHLPGVAAEAQSAAVLTAMDRLVERLAVAAPPPLLATAEALGCPAAGIVSLERERRIVRLNEDLAWAMATYRELAARALAMAMDGPLTPAAYRDATGTSRKYVMAILEDLDRRAILRRTPEGHVPGPRAPRLRESVART